MKMNKKIEKDFTNLIKKFNIEPDLVDLKSLWDSELSYQENKTILENFLKQVGTDLKRQVDVKAEELEIEESQESGKTIFGFLVMVPSGGSKKIIISYALSQKIPLDQPSFNYSNWVFKQPGTEEDPYSFSLTYPESLKVFNLPKDLRSSNNQILFSKKLITDINFEIGFSKK